MRIKVWLGVLGVVAAALALVVVATPSTASTSRWQQVNLPTNGGSIYGLDDVKFTDAAHGYIVGRVYGGPFGNLASIEPWFTSDGGRSWVLRPTHPRGRGIDPLGMGDDTHGWFVLGGGTTATIYGTADTGRTWTEQAVLSGDAEGIAAIDARHAWLWGYEGFLAATTDGRHWHKLTPPTTNTEYLQFLDRADGWLVDTSGRLYTTGDAGRTWTRLRRVWHDPFRAVDFVNLTTGWATAVHGVYKTTNGGRTWTKQLGAPAPGAVGPIHFSDASHGWVEDGPLLHTADGGRSWTRQAPPGPYLSALTSTPSGDEWAVGLAAFRYPHGA
jgi:photosystem II stability/assembly factor-like uncharacterized protein